ncbi:helix-turn-helix domain-containing protein [Sphingomonas sp. KC8]|uniref:helix-turn-helix domain-containing protein n=1 Tax=Sphingomonas sp. KC8 TaxID=1030157 RepID=UPI000248A79B|nr:helix-turn-helix transcriptional regulator [Sphingomonas sp. KC8]ARS26860.1 AraC family transcriptional regulator [Sphingomonas sp. KC8]
MGLMEHDLPSLPEAYRASLPSSIRCEVQGRIALPQAVIELHDYQFDEPQRAIFKSPRSFLDLALSRRPGDARGGYVDLPGFAARPLGDIIFIPAGHAVATEWGAGRQQSICCGFEGGRPDDEDDLFASAELEACLDIRSPFIRDAMVRLAREVRDPGFCSDLLVGAMWIEIAVELGRHLRRSRHREEEDRARLSAAKLRLVDDWIAQPGAMPAVSELADACGMSARHFFRMFKASTGMTLSDYAAAMRLDRAKALLATDRLAIKVIAWECGFGTAAAFSAAFRRAVGVTPHEYRRSAIH